MQPFLRPLGLFLAALLLRVNDIFILRLDERWGEILLSKAGGFLLILLSTYASGHTLADLGLHARNLRKAILVTVVAIFPIYVAAYGLQVAVLQAAGRRPALELAAIDPKTGMAGGLLFAVWLLFGNAMNSFMEEGLFRGVMLTRFGTVMGRWQAVLLQAGFFALWHLVWPVKDLLVGRTTLAGATGQAAMLLAATAISGFVYGYLCLRTGSLWAPWLAHTINNSVLNLLHIRTPDGLDANLFVLNLVLVLGLLSVIPLIRALSGGKTLSFDRHAQHG